MNLKAFKPAPLTEALRFGQREIANVIKSNNILCGIEYEFHVNAEELEPDWDQIFDNYADQIREDFFRQHIENQLEDYLEDAATYSGDYTTGCSELADLDLFTNVKDHIQLVNRLVTSDPNDDRTITLAYRFVELCKNLDQNMTSDISHVRDIAEEVNKHDWVLLNHYSTYNHKDGAASKERLTAAVDFWTRAADVLDAIYESVEFEYILTLTPPAAIDNPDQMLLPLEDHSEDVEVIIGMASDIKAPLEKMLDFDIASIKETFNIIDDLGEYEQDIIDNCLYWLDDQLNAWWEEYRQDFVDQHGIVPENGDDYVRYITDMLEDRDLYSELNIDTVKIDASVENGVEVVTRPMPIREVPNNVEEMFDFIKSVGWTSVQTGLHVNLSVKGVDMKEAFDDPITALKLYMLLDETFIRQGGNLKNIRDRNGKQVTDFNSKRWKVRDYVEDVLNDDVWIKILEDLHTHQTKSFEEIFGKNILLDTKTH